MKRLIRIKKSISIITALCLLVSFVIGPTAANAMTNEEATKQYKQIFKEFVLPYSYGQITSAHYAGTDRVIINIQDLHCHPKVQKNISNIIETFDKSYGVKKIYLEGAYGQVDTSWLTKKVQEYNVPNLLDKMLETGRLTGAEYYSASSGKTEIINGLEEKEPYLENLKRFGNIIENQEKINLILNAMDESLVKLKQQYYTKRQYKLEKLSNDYKEGTISPQKYYALLSKHVEKLGIDISKYDNTFTYMMLLEMQKSLDYSKITRELQNLVLLLKEQIPYNAYKLLLENTENFAKVDKLYVYLVQISKAYNLDLSVNFPNLDKYFGYIEFSQKINPLELISEEELLIQEINTRFSETRAQREVVFLTNFGRYLKDYVSSKITSSDYEYYKENIGEYRDLWNKYVDNRVLSLLDEYIAEADKFYKINTDRNIYFTRNMFGEKEELNRIETEVEAKGDVNKIIENMKGVKEVDVVVTGGFHSQTVTEILKKEGVSYIVITPNVTDGVKLAEETYYEIAREQSKISFQALANLIASLLPLSKQQEIFDLAMGTKTEKEDITKLSQEQRIEKLEIAAAKLLESDDEGNVLDKIREELNKYSKEPITEEDLGKINVDRFKKIMGEGDIEKTKRIVDALQQPILKKALTIIEETTRTYESYLKEQIATIEEKQRKEEKIKQIKALPKLSEAHKKLLMSRDGKYKRILEELSKYDYENLDGYSEEDLQHCLELLKQLWNITEIKSADEVRKEIEKAFAKVEMFFTLIGYSAPQGDYEKITMAVLAPLMEEISKVLGKEKFGILSSPTADKGSIDATSTVLSQMYDALMVYVTAKDYLKYVTPSNFPNGKTFEDIEKLLGEIDKQDLVENGTNLVEFLNAFKFVAENGSIYSKAVAQTKNVPNFAIIIGGRAVALNNDFTNALNEGNEIILINSRKLAKQSQAPAIDHKKLSDLSTPYILNNSVDYLLNLVSLMEKGIISYDGVLNDDSSLEFTESEAEAFFNFQKMKEELGKKRDELKAKQKELNKQENTQQDIERIRQEIKNLEQEIQLLEQKVYDEGEEIEKIGSLKIFYNLLKAKGISEDDKKLISLLVANELTSLDALGRRVHIINMNDANIKTDTQMRKEGERVAKKIYKIVKKFIKKPTKLHWFGSVKSAEIEVQAFDLEYAKKNGFLDGVDEPKYDKNGVRYYTLKAQYDKDGHFKARIYEPDSNNPSLSARTDNVSLNPMFVIYANGTVGFMSREKFSKVYRTDIDTNKEDQIFKATKNEVEVQVSFIEPMSIIVTDEGRDTVLPGDIVVKSKDGKPYAMSIAEFMRIYPQEKNPEFYKQHKEQIDRLFKEYFGFNVNVDLTLKTTEQIMDERGIKNKTLRKIYAAFYEARKYRLVTRFNPLEFVKKHYAESQDLSYEELGKLIEQLEALKREAKHPGMDYSYYDYVRDEKEIPEIEKMIDDAYPGFLTRLQGARRIAVVTNAVSIASFVSALFIGVNFFPLIVSELAISYAVSVLSSILAVWLMGDLANGLTHAIYNLRNEKFLLTIGKRKKAYEQAGAISKENLSSVVSYISENGNTAAKMKALNKRVESIAKKIKGMTITDMEMEYDGEILKITIGDGIHRRYSIDRNGNIINIEEYHGWDYEWEDITVSKGELETGSFSKVIEEILNLKGAQKATAETDKAKLGNVVRTIFEDGNETAKERVSALNDILQRLVGKEDITDIRVEMKDGKIRIVVGDGWHKSYSIDREGNIEYEEYHGRDYDWVDIEFTEERRAYLERESAGYRRVMETLLNLKAEDLIKGAQKATAETDKDKLGNVVRTIFEDGNETAKQRVSALNDILQRLVGKEDITDIRVEMKDGKIRIVVGDGWHKSYSIDREGNIEYEEYHGRDYDWVDVEFTGEKREYLQRESAGYRRVMETLLNLKAEDLIKEAQKATADTDKDKLGNIVSSILNIGADSANLKELKNRFRRNKEVEKIELINDQLCITIADGIHRRYYIDREGNITCEEYHGWDYDYEDITLEEGELGKGSIAKVIKALLSLEEEKTVEIAQEKAEGVAQEKTEEIVQEKAEEIDYKTIRDLIKAGINPMQMAMDSIKSLFSGKIKLKGNVILVKETQRGIEVPGDVTKIIYEIETEKNDTIKLKNYNFGVIEGRTIRAYKKGNKIIFYSKHEEGLEGIDEKTIENLFIETLSSGIKDGVLTNVDVIAFARETDETTTDIENRIEIARKSGIIKAETEINFDVEKEQFNVNKCEQEHKATGANTFTLSQERVNESDRVEIKKAREEGYRIRLSYKHNNIPSDIEYDGIQIDATEVKTKEEAKKILNQLKDKCNVEKTISVEFSKEVYELLNEEGTDIFKEYGVLPIVDVDSIKYVKGRKEVKKITEQTNIEEILANDEIVGVIVDSENKSLFSIIKDMFKIKTSKYDRGLNVGLREAKDENSKYSLEDISKIKEILKAGRIETADIETLSEVLTAEDMVYLKYLLEKDKEKQEEAVGFIMGRAMRTMKQQWQTRFTNIDDNSFMKEAKGQYEKGLLLLMLSMQVSGVNIQDLLEQASEVEDRGWNMTAEEMYKVLGKQATEIITRVLNENDKKIKKLESEELAKAKEDFGILNNIIQDRFRARKEITEVKISALAVRSMLAAA